MSRALGVLKLFFSLVSINSTELPYQGAPQVANPLDRTEVYTGRAFTIPIPKDTFYDKEDSTNLRLSMTTGDGKTLPPWIRFNPQPKSKDPEVYGFPLQGNAPHTFNFSIIAHDLQNATARADLIIQVKEGSFPHNHEVILSTDDLPYQDYMRNLDLRFNLATNLANYVMGLSPSDIWVKDFDKEMTLTIVFRNIKYSPCDKEAIDNMEKKLNERDHLMVESSAPTQKPSKKYRIKVKKVKVNLLDSCSIGPDPPDPPVGLGWMKHVLPVLILLVVVGVPVTISIFVRKSKAKSARERRRRASGLGRKKEEDASFTYHTVHYNNRYPSMLSVSNNSKEEATTDEEKSCEVNANSSNSRRLAIPNGKTKIPHVQNSGTCNLNQNVEKKPENTKKPVRSMREIMYEDDDDESAEKAELNIPVYYNIRKGEVAAENTPIMDVNLTELAGNISSKLMDIGKGVLSVTPAQAEPVKKKAIDEVSTVSSNPQDTGNSLGKSFLNQTDYVKTEGPISASPSISSKLVDFTKSVLNVSQGQSQTSSDTFENEPSALTKLRHFGKSMLNLTGGQGSSSKDDPVEAWEPYGYSENETSQLYGWEDAHGNYGPCNMEVPEYDTPSHRDECCYNFYDVTTDALEYSEHSLGYTGETETSALSYVHDEYRDVDMNELYRQKEEEASRFMRSFEVDPPSARNEWELGDSYTDKAIYQEYVNPYHYGDGTRNNFSLNAKTGRSWLSSEMFGQDEYGRENLHRSQQELFSSMPELFEQPPDQQRRGSWRSQSGERGASLLGSLFSLKQQDKDDSGSITSFIKTQVKGILGQSEGNVSKWPFQKSDSLFT